MNDFLEALGFALIAGFAFFIWAPAALLVVGVVLVVKANARSLKAKNPASKPLLDRLLAAALTLRGART